MEQNNELKLFEDKKIRAKWDEEKEKWDFSVVDVVAVLTDNDYQKSRNYWKWLKNKLIQEGSELVSDTNQLKMKSVDGKYYNTDVMNTEQVLRLIQSIPSKKAEPFKIWLVQVGKERIDEAYDPEIAINRALDIYRKKGYSEEWINQRLKTIDIRKEFTDELKEKGISEAKDFAILTNILTQAWSGHSVKEYKNLKGLKKENLPDNMTNMELVLNMLAETSSTEISKSKKEKGFMEAQDSVIEGGNIARVAREQLERKTGKKVVSDKNAKEIRKLNSGKEQFFEITRKDLVYLIFLVILENLPISYKRDIKKAIKIIKENNSKEIFIFGSLVNGNYNENSDIDIAVRGLSQDKFYKVASILLFELENEFDLIDLDDEQNGFSQILLKIGGLLKVG